MSTVPLHPQLDAMMHAAPAATYTSATATVLFWGLHVSDLAVILSAFATLCSVGLQFYVVFSKINRLEKAVAKTDKVAAVTNAKVESLENQ